MARRSVLAQRTLWTVPVIGAALAFWLVGAVVGWRGWLMVGPSLGIVGHTEAFGRAAAPWFIVAATLTLTALVMGIGVAIVRHLVDSQLGPSAAVSPVAAVETVPALEPVPELQPVGSAELDETEPGFGPEGETSETRRDP